MTSNASLKFSIGTKHTVTCWTVLEQWHPSIPGLRLSSFLCQLWMSRWSAMTQQQDCGNCGWSAEILLENSACLWCEAPWEWAGQNFKQWNTCRGQVLWECFPAALVMCLAVAPVPAEQQHQGWRFSVSWCQHVPQLMVLEGSTERFLSAFILGLSISRQSHGNLWNETFSVLTKPCFSMPQNCNGTWCHGWSPGTRQVSEDEDGEALRTVWDLLQILCQIQQSLSQMISIPWSSGYSLWFQ